MSARLSTTSAHFHHDPNLTLQAKPSEGRRASYQYRGYVLALTNVKAERSASTSKSLHI
jgi:hypothetical protein